MVTGSTENNEIFRVTVECLLSSGIWRIYLFLWGGGVDYDIEHCHLLSYFLPNLQLNIGKKYLFLNLNELADTWALALTWHLFDFYIFSLSIILNIIIFQPVSSSDSSSQKSMIIGYMTLLSIQFSLQYFFFNFDHMFFCFCPYIFCNFSESGVREFFSIF